MIKIERGVPIPPPARSRSAERQNKYPFDTMEVGDSFFVATKADETSAGIQRRLTACAAMHKPMRYATRRVDGGVRCWRIA